MPETNTSPCRSSLRARRFAYERLAERVVVKDRILSGQMDDVFVSKQMPEDALEHLRAVFRHNQQPSAGVVQNIADTICMPKAKIRNWFANERQKAARERRRLQQQGLTDSSTTSQRESPTGDGTIWLLEAPGRGSHTEWRAYETFDPRSRCQDNVPMAMGVDEDPDNGSLMGSESDGDALSAGRNGFDAMFHPAGRLYTIDPATTSPVSDRFSLLSGSPDEGARVGVEINENEAALILCEMRRNYMRRVHEPPLRHH